MYHESSFVLANLCGEEGPTEVTCQASRAPPPLGLPPPSCKLHVSGTLCLALCQAGSMEETPERRDLRFVLNLLTVLKTH